MKFFFFLGKNGQVIKKRTFIKTQKKYNSKQNKTKKNEYYLNYL